MAQTEGMSHGEDERLAGDRPGLERENIPVDQNDHHAEFDAFHRVR